ncbi:chromosomal replication initiator DnaA [Palleronia sp.]|uniref:chromosomal replication initiator DnaA n=1 Tax=Palleronia sp. TaxID=1940284 RepID=UPI0035C7ED9F
MAEQLPLNLQIRPALGREDFVVTPSNATALGLLESHRWPGGRLALIGPPASGKTHLAHVWAERAGAVVVSAKDLPRFDIATLASAGRVAVEEVAAIAGHRGAETALFHLYNRLASSGGRLLVTGREPPARWPVALPDLRSRLSALTVAALDAPDDALLGSLLEKQLRDRGLEPDMSVLTYLVPRMPRTAEAARDLAAEIDRLTLSRKRGVGRELAKEALSRIAVSSSRHEPEAKDAP